MVLHSIFHLSAVNRPISQPTVFPHVKNLLLPQRTTLYRFPRPSKRGQAASVQVLVLVQMMMILLRTTMLPSRTELRHPARLLSLTGVRTATAQSPHRPTWIDKRVLLVV